MRSEHLIPKDIRQLAIGTSVRGDFDPDDEWLPMTVLTKRFNCSAYKILKIVDFNDVPSRMNGREKIYPLKRLRKAFCNHGSAHRVRQPVHVIGVEVMENGAICVKLSQKKSLSYGPDFTKEEEWMIRLAYVCLVAGSVKTKTKRARDRAKRLNALFCKKNRIFAS